MEKLTHIPSSSGVAEGFGRVDYFDAWQIRKKTAEPASVIMKEIMKLPAWAVALFKLRNAVVRPFGLKADKAEAAFPVIFERDDEIVTGLADKHLDFRVSVLKDPAAETVSMTTLVRFNNGWGRLYFLPVKPFHKLLMKVLLKRYLG